MILVLRILLLAAFAVWFGGFTFYTAVVVPVGTDVLGSSRTQGFVTQQVTQILNFVGGVTLTLGVVDLFISRRLRTRKTNGTLAIVLTVLVLTWIALLVVHPLLDRMLEPEHDYVTDELRFYQWHRVYLWVSTVQWLVCWIWLAVLARDWNRPGSLPLVTARSS